MTVRSCRKITPFVITNVHGSNHSLKVQDMTLVSCSNYVYAALTLPGKLKYEQMLIGWSEAQALSLGVSLPCQCQCLLCNGSIYKSCR